MVCNNIIIEKLSFISFNLRIETLIYDYLDTCRASLNLVEKTWLRGQNDLTINGNKNISPH